MFIEAAQAEFTPSLRSFPNDSKETPPGRTWITQQVWPVTARHDTSDKIMKICIRAQGKMAAEDRPTWFLRVRNNYASEAGLLPPARFLI